MVLIFIVNENTVKIRFPPIVVQMVHSDMMCDKLYDTFLHRRLGLPKDWILPVWVEVNYDVHYSSDFQITFHEDLSIFPDIYISLKVELINKT